jgi:hypothetical protein
MELGTKFTAIKDFGSTETQSQYEAGMSYTVRTPKLAKLAEQWLKEGKIKLDGKVVLALVSGTGTVSRKGK